MAGNGAASNLEGFIYTAMNSIYQAAVTFISQNVGARKLERIRRIVIICLIVVLCVGLILGVSEWIFHLPLLGIYTSEAEVIHMGEIRNSIIATTYFLCGMMDVMTGVLRGMGYSLQPMIISVAGACGFRVLWIFTIFQQSRSLRTLYISYPISWIITFIAQFICYLIYKKKLMIRLQKETALERSQI